ncbi:hypothetical protein C8J57DRAFT_1246956 [Mycena rebaudengoi]|nr:hypothetical protein C8J57DRAFT_1246956 [Mycena rebaudengoi]
MRGQHRPRKITLRLSPLARSLFARRQRFAAAREETKSRARSEEVTAAVGTGIVRKEAGQATEMKENMKAGTLRTACHRNGINYEARLLITEDWSIPAQWMSCRESAQAPGEPDTNAHVIIDIKRVWLQTKHPWCYLKIQTSV